MEKIFSLASGIFSFFLLFSPLSLTAQWTSAHPGMEWRVFCTGRTTMHVLNIWATNVSEDTITSTIGPFYIPGPKQPYVTTGKHTLTVPPGSTVVLPLTGYCTDRDVKPPAAGREINPDDFLTPDDVTMPQPGAPLSASDGWKEVGIPENASLILKYPGTETAFPYQIDDVSKRPEQVAPLFLEASRLLDAEYELLEAAGDFFTPVSTNPVREEDVLTQLAIWQYSTMLEGDDFSVEDYREDVHREYRKRTGVPVSRLSEDERNVLDAGADALWSASLDLGESAPIINRPETYYKYTEACRCDSFYLDAVLVASSLGTRDTITRVREVLYFEGRDKINNPVIKTDWIVFDPGDRSSYFKLADYLSGESLFSDSYVYDLVEDLFGEKGEAMDWYEEFVLKLRAHFKATRENYDLSAYDARLAKVIPLNRFLQFSFEFNTLDLDCRCNQRDEDTNEYEECMNLYARYGGINDDLKPENPGQLDVRLSSTKYKYIIGQEEERSGKTQKARKPITISSLFHDHDQGGNIGEITVGLDPGETSMISKVKLSLVITGFCSDEDCGNPNNLTQCRKYLRVEFKGFSSYY